MRLLSSEVTPELDGKTVEVAGWAHERRDLGGIKFIVLRDRGGFLQVTGIKKSTDPKIFDQMGKIGAETVIKVTGKVQASKQAPRGVELIPGKIEVLAESLAKLPIDPTWKTPSELDTRLDNRLLDLRRPEITAIFRVRSVVVEALREYMRSQDFTEVALPMIVKAGAEGGSLLFPVAYFDQEAFLSQSGQLYKQYMACTNLERVFLVGPSWRAEPSHTIRHLNEFWQLDFEQAFIESEEDVMATTEGVFAHAVSKVVQKCQKELGILKIQPVVPKTPFPRIKFKEVVDMLSREGVEIPTNADIPDYAEKKLGELMAEKGHAAYFITKFPRPLRAFYIMSDGDLSRGFDLDYRGLEMCSGGQREHRLNNLIGNMKYKGYDPSAFDFYLNIFRYGAPPHGGVGIGVERVLQSILNLPNIREAIPFPRDTKRLVP